MIDYRSGPIALDDALAVYRACSLGARRPVDDRERFAAMLAEADLVVSAWDADRPVGVARALSDGVWCTYLADLAVAESHQRRGIGRELVRRVRDAAPQATLVLLAAPEAAAYYPRLGFERSDRCWLLPRGAPLS